MANILLLDAPPVLLLVSGRPLLAYPVRRWDWPEVPAGAAVALLSTGEGLDYGPRILWVGKAVTNLLTSYRGGALAFVPADPRPGDDPVFRFEASEIKRLYLLNPPTPTLPVTRTAPARHPRG
ncbi:hypothetical protein DNI29_19245 [Hymenobacter sediminis]|uniref:hypothetical protein n=1 Tax=Hymenobacter sediminis TaxID=2218621 RepID=UPI000F4EF9BF|nr:hypothetical protein [Hymenobacter sediminis]RPD44846.1 hypothetical protein DNI29_19245 [Hymenobacter sediminis]